MHTAVENAEFIGKELNAPLVIAAHPPKGDKKGGTVSGSGVVDNASAALWSIQRIPKADLKDPRRKASVLRNKSGGEGSAVNLHIESVDIPGPESFGKPLTGAVVVPDASLSTTPLGAVQAQKDAEREAVRRLRQERPDLSLRDMAHALGPGWNHTKVDRILKGLEAAPQARVTPC
jgi:hypothetical protein